MQNNKSSITALISSLARAYHSENDHPKIFDDTIAKRLMTDEEYVQIQNYMVSGIDFFAPEKKYELKSASEILKWVVQTQLAPTPLARSRYAEDMLKNALLIGAEQYVILGAGMDTFAYRNADLLSKIHVFEVDHPASQEFKKQKIRQAALLIPDNLHYISLDFDKSNLSDALINAGFDKSKQTFFSLLGVSYYLSKEQLSNIFSAVYSISLKGNSIVFDYADENLFSSNIKRVQNMIAMANAAGEPMNTCFSYSDLEKILDNSGFLIYEHLSSEEIEKRFFSYRTDFLHAFEHICYTLAVVSK